MWWPNLDGHLCGCGRAWTLIAVLAAALPAGIVAPDPDPAPPPAPPARRPLRLVTDANALQLHTNEDDMFIDRDHDWQPPPPQEPLTRRTDGGKPPRPGTTSGNSRRSTGSSTTSSGSDGKKKGRLLNFFSSFHGKKDKVNAPLADIESLQLSVFARSRDSSFPEKSRFDRKKPNVYISEHTKSRVLCAVKHNVQYVEAMDNEIAMLKATDMAISKLPPSPFIVRYYYNYNEQGAGKNRPRYSYLVSELIVGDNLDTLVRKGKLTVNPTKMADTLDVIAQIVMAVEDVHIRGLIHAYVEPANLVRCKKTGRVVLINFHHAKKRLHDDVKHDFSEAVKTAFSAPEINYADQLGFNHIADLYSLGAVIYYILCRKEYHNEHSMRKTDICDRVEHDDDAHDLITKLLVIDQRHRFGGGPTGMSEVKRHPFFHSVDWKTLREKYHRAQVQETPKQLIRLNLND